MIWLTVHTPDPTAPLHELEFEPRWASEHTHRWVLSCWFDLWFSQSGTLAASWSDLEKKNSNSILDKLLWLAMVAQQPQQVGWINTKAGFFWTMSPPLFLCVCVCVCVCERERGLCGPKARSTEEIRLSLTNIFSFISVLMVQWFGGWHSMFQGRWFKKLWRDCPAWLSSGS